MYEWVKALHVSARRISEAYVMSKGSIVSTSRWGPPDRVGNYVESVRTAVHRRAILRVTTTTKRANFAHS